MVREDKNMPLMEAISKMSYLHAKYFDELGGIPQFRTKGRVQVGADADIVVFNPDTVTDNSTYEPGMGALPSTGIPHVLVNGVVVVKNPWFKRSFRVSRFVSQSAEGSAGPDYYRTQEI